MCEYSGVYRKLSLLANNESGQEVHQKADDSAHNIGIVSEQISALQNGIIAIHTNWRPQWSNGFVVHR